MDEEIIIPPQIKVMNEYDLHIKVVEYIRKFYKHAIIVPGLGEHQFNGTLRCKSYLKGYTAGQSDLLILNHHVHYTGLAIEFKTPKGKGRISSYQLDFIKNLQLANYKTIISNDYDEIINELTNYMNGV